jgi:serine protease AprX
MQIYELWMAQMSLKPGTFHICLKNQNFENNMRILILCLWSVFQLLEIQAQTHNLFLLLLDERETLTFPALSREALENRHRLNIPLNPGDYPVNAGRIQELDQDSSISVTGISRWVNAAFILTTLTPAELDSRFPWHKGLYPLKESAGRARFIESSPLPEDISPNKVTSDYGFASVQTRQVGLDCLHDKGYTGRGVRVAIFDSGFRNVHQLSAFDSLFAEGRVPHIYDFVNQDQSVFDEDNHGTNVFSVIAARQPGIIKGSAWQSTFFLARTETIFSETTQEEQNWLMAMEWADSLGAQVIQASLGYNKFDGGGGYTYADLNGQTTLVTRAAAMAVSKGLAVVVSAGNEGSNSWGYMTVPADADSILAVGSVDNMGVRSGFSSIGPTADGRIKPDVMAMGSSTAIITTSGSISNSSGTSFSSPIIAGMAACLMQAHPGRAGWEISNAIRMSADRYGNPDNQYGYGIPDACIADSLLSLTTGLTETNSQPVLMVFPNPAKDQLNIESHEKILFPVSLFNSDGKLMLQSDKTEFSLAFLPHGTYWLSIPLEQKGIRIVPVIKE